MITAQAIRFCDDVPAMRRFCETLGLAATVTSDDTWAVMRSASGDVLLHSARSAESDVVPGQTELTFETDDLDALAAGFGASPIDEAYGRSVRITDPHGDQLWINERQTDFYGYRRHDARPSAELSVCPVLFTDPCGPYADFLGTLGLRRDPGSDGDFASFRADQGAVGLHVAREGEYEQYLTGHAGVRVQLTFTTTGDPQALAAKLRGAGYEVVVDNSFGTMLQITDPDGRTTQVHAG